MTVEPLVTSEPLTEKVAKVLTLESAETTTVTLRVVTVPSAAVTMIETVLVPVNKPVRPLKVTPAAESVGTATTATEVVPAATMIEPFSATV